MIQKVKFYGEIKDGKLLLDNRRLFDAYLKSQKGRIELNLEKESKDITKEQRGYYYGVIIPLASRETGHSEEEIDGVLKRAFLTVNKGDKLEYVRSTTTLTRQEYSEFIDKVIIRLAENGIVCPEPNQKWRK